MVKWAHAGVFGRGPCIADKSWGLLGRKKVDCKDYVVLADQSLGPDTLGLWPKPNHFNLFKEDYYV